MRKTVLLASILISCVSEPKEAPHEIRASEQALIVVQTSAPDSLAVDGACSLREAWRAAANGITSPDCPNDGSRALQLGPGTWTMAIPNPTTVSTEDTSSAVGDLDLSGNVSITITATGPGPTVLDAAQLDRVFHVKGAASLTLEGPIEVINGCVNAPANAQGACSTATVGSEPVGGLIYFNSSGRFRAPLSAWRNGRARTGGAMGLCSALDSDAALEGATFTGNYASLGGGAIDSHTTWSCTGCAFTGNSSGGIGGAVRQYDRVATIMFSDAHGNSAAQAGGAYAAVGQWNASTSGHVDAIGGDLYGNSATIKAGNFYVGASGAQGASGFYSVPCSAAGCSGSVNGIDVQGGAAPTGPDCTGVLDLFDGASVANPAGCSIVAHDPPICGDHIVNGSEQCDDGNLEDGDMCSSDCRIEQCLLYGMP